MIGFASLSVSLVYLFACRWYTDRIGFVQLVVFLSAGGGRWSELRRKSLSLVQREPDFGFALSLLLSRVYLFACWWYLPAGGGTWSELRRQILTAGNSKAAVVAAAWGGGSSSTIEDFGRTTMVAARVVGHWSQVQSRLYTGNQFGQGVLLFEK